MYPCSSARFQFFDGRQQMTAALCADSRSPTDPGRAASFNLDIPVVYRVYSLGQWTPDRLLEPPEYLGVYSLWETFELKKLASIHVGMDWTSSTLWGRLSKWVQITIMGVGRVRSLIKWLVYEWFVAKAAPTWPYKILLFFVPLYLTFGFIIKKEYFRGWLYILTNGLGLLENY